ncbi:tetratricopeptide repeat protein [Pseudoprimorskyibacter insulae]|uniref:Uncharacterized protein n=1 Tax=Pseudoprimorskyibacter insulae TaxID=1695997 RepID=A0A2R8AYK8_9RHOB|nr:tetratricopeptide repeat protein [Pseudoprimorskyibacter insulae]SPF80959.1 hypothetical protein PRI8871_02773 [Pseudoprimorskyibacter insulae]
MLILALLAACSSGGFGRQKDQIYAPSVDPRGDTVDGLVVGHRLMAAGQHELALEAFTRAAGEHGLTGEVLSALGAANIGLGRLNQAEKLLRRAVKAEPTWPETWNNLGVVLMETGKTAEAEQMFKRAYALDNGKSDSIRDNLRLALEKMDQTSYGEDQEQDYKLVRRGSGNFLLSNEP